MLSVEYITTTYVNSRLDTLRFSSMIHLNNALTKLYRRSFATLVVDAKSLRDMVKTNFMQHRSFGTRNKRCFIQQQR